MADGLLTQDEVAAVFTNAALAVAPPSTRLALRASETTQEGTRVRNKAATAPGGGEQRASGSQGLV